MPPLPHQRAYASCTTSVRRFDWVKCKSATKWDPTRTLKQGFDLWALFAWRVGSQSAPIWTPPQRQICETAQYLAAVYGWGPTSVLKDIKAPPKFFVACVLARSASPRHVYRPHPSAHMTHAMLDAGGGLDRHRSYLSSGIGFYAE